MAKEVLHNAYVMINNVDLSDHVQSITLPLSCAEIDATCMGADSVARLAGLKDCSLTITWAQNFASAKVDATLYAMYLANIEKAIKVRQDTGAIAATNPEYQFNAIITEYSPIDGSVGEFSTVPSTFMASGDVSRDTTP